MVQTLPMQQTSSWRRIKSIHSSNIRMRMDEPFGQAGEGVSTYVTPLRQGKPLVRLLCTSVGRAGGSGHARQGRSPCPMVKVGTLRVQQPQLVTRAAPATA